jgi:hypothetical protein
MSDSYPLANMTLWLQRCWLVLVVLLVASPPSAAAEAPAGSRSVPLPRPRLTEALRAKVETEPKSNADGAAIKMEKVIVREARLPSGPPKDEKREGPFSITQGGYVLKDRGERFSTEIGLWRHIDIIEDPRDALRQSDRIRMGFLRVSW